MSRPSQEELRRLGQSLREIDPKMLHADPTEGPVRWFLGEQGTEITAWVNAEGAPHHMQLVFWRVSVEWTPTSLSTGTFASKGTTAGGRYDPYLLSVSGGVDPEVCVAAQEVLGASDIDAKIRDPLLASLAKAAGS